MTPPRIVACQGEDCDAAIVQQPIGGRRRFCGTCRAARDRASNTAWKRANPAKQAQYQRDRRQRRRYDTTRRTA